MDMDELVMAMQEAAVKENDPVVVVMRFRVNMIQTKN